jgi:hypothetical protein
MRHRSTVTLLALLGCAFAAPALAGTKIVKSWREPSAGPLKFSRVLVLVMAPHESQMLFGEAELVSLMKRTRGVAAHSVMPKDDAQDEQKMRAFMQKEGFDGAVTLRYIAAGAQTTEQPGLYVPSYTGFWSYYSYAWPLVYDMGYVKMDRVITMEAQIFAMKDDKLLWSGLTQSKNPKSAKTMVHEVVQAVGADLKKQGLVE